MVHYMKSLIIKDICGVCFFSQQIYAIQRDHTSACHYLQVGADFAGSAHSEYTRLLFILSKGMVGNKESTI